MYNITLEFKYYQTWEFSSFDKIFYCWILPYVMFKLPIHHNISQSFVNQFYWYLK